MKKKILSERRILIGLLGLLFLMGFIHTMGILNLSRNMTSRVGESSQTAQVPSPGNACMQITPKLSYGDTVENANGSTGTETWFSMFLDIKNICSTNIYLVNPDSWPAGSALQYSLLQTLAGQNQPTYVSTPTSTTYGTTLTAEFMSCATCGPTPNYPSTFLSTGFVRGIMIPPNQTKTFTYNVSVMKSYAFLSNYLAVFPISFRWFKQAALSDNNVISSEVLIHALPTTDPLRRTSFVR